MPKLGQRHWRTSASFARSHVRNVAGGLDRDIERHFGDRHRQWPQRQKTHGVLRRRQDSARSALADDGRNPVEVASRVADGDRESRSSLRPSSPRGEAPPRTGSGFAMPASATTGPARLRPRPLGFERLGRANGAPQREERRVVWPEIRRDRRRPAGLCAAVDENRISLSQARKQANAGDRTARADRRRSSGATMTRSTSRASVVC